MQQHNNILTSLYYYKTKQKFARRKITILRIKLMDNNEFGYEMPIIITFVDCRKVEVCIQVCEICFAYLYLNIYDC